MLSAAMESVRVAMACLVRGLWKASGPVGGVAGLPLRLGSVGLSFSSVGGGGEMKWFKRGRLFRRCGRDRMVRAV